MQNIELTIESQMPDSYSILLRKLFCMMFIDEKGKKLDIFIASVYGGIANTRKEYCPDKTPIATYCKDDSGAPLSCELSFSFKAKGHSDSDMLYNIEFSDCTDSFWKQSNMFERFWDNAKKLTNETLIKKHLSECYNSLYSTPASVPQVNWKFDNPPLYIENKKSTNMSCIATKGEITEIEGGYKITPSIQIDGIETLNWVKTEISLKESILDKRVHFTIYFKGKEFYSPDFSWYFAPPPTYEVIENDASLILGKNKAEQNRVQHLAETTTVRFKEWEKLRIGDRQKARITGLKGTDTIDKMKDPDNTNQDISLYSIQVTFGIHVDPTIHTNRQFFWGLIVAFLISLCADKTRMNDFYLCIQKSICNCPSPCICQFFCNAISIVLPIIAVL